MVKQLFNRFISEDRGNVIMIFGGAVIVMVMLVGGAIDLSRYLVARTQAQVALDNAVLAASAVKENQSLSEVASRFFKANFPSNMGRTGNVRISSSDDGSVITGEVDIYVKSFFGGFLGVDEYKFSGLGEVIFGEADAEIVLVLDHSKSMCQSNSFGSSIVDDPSCRKLNAVKRASQTFIQTIYTGTSSLRNAYIGIVPFNHNVIMPSKHPALGADVDTDGGVASSGMVPVTELTDDQSHLSSRINAMGNPHNWATTRTNVGTAVGALMLMPYAQDRRHFNHRANLPQPFDPFSRDKVLVLMTDGANATRLRSNARADRKAGRPYTIDLSNSSNDNSHQQALCAHLKNHYEIVIYSVTYDMPNNAQAQATKDVFRNCATNKQFYFDAQSDQDLQVAYKIIADSINKLRLSR